MTTDDLHALASLHNLPGYRILLDKVVKLKKEDSLQRLKLARGQEDIMSAALEFRVWDEVASTLESAPRNAVNDLKAEGDNIYG